MRFTVPVLNHLSVFVALWSPHAARALHGNSVNDRVVFRVRRLRDKEQMRVRESALKNHLQIGLSLQHGYNLLELLDQMERPGHARVKIGPQFDDQARWIPSIRAARE